MGGWRLGALPVGSCLFRLRLVSFAMSFSFAVRLMGKVGASQEQTTYNRTSM